ncbi:hypothetical protein GCM10020000_79190 [Streptomyces olivoverticillatus]
MPCGSWASSRSTTASATCPRRSANWHPAGWTLSSTTSAAEASPTPGTCSPPGGTLIAYGSASTRDDTGSKQWPVLKILARTWLWNILPNGRHAHFYNIWAGRALSKDRFRDRLRADLTEVFAALGRGDVTARIAAQLPLTKAAEALRLAESGTVTGKVVLTP